MTRRKLNTWQPNEITSIIRSTQDATSPTVSPSASFQVDSNSNTVIEAESIEDKMEAKYTSQGTELASFHRDDSFASQQTLAPSSSATQDMQPQDSIIAQVSTPGNLKRTSSMVRLAMSLDGQASVILRGQTPSPPNKIVTGHVDGRVSIQRSESLITSSLLASTLDVPSAIPRVPGRSKDTRSWEFWCDSERREALTKSAEINQRGSAAGPISLLRSGSYGFNSYGNMVASLKKRKSEEDIGVDRRHKLSRTRSSNARLQFHEDDVDSLKGKKSGTTTIYRDGGDSDKENVDPDPIGDLWARRRILSPKGVDKKREVLEQNTSVPSQSASLGALVTKDNKKTPAKKVKSSAKEKNTPAKKSKRARKTVAANDKENVVVESEGAGIMKEGSADREEDDELDAVQNLLRLSRGDWK